MDEVTRTAAAEPRAPLEAVAPPPDADLDDAAAVDETLAPESPADPQAPAMPGISSRAAGTILGLSEDLLPALIARLDASALGELEVRTDAWRVRLRKAYDRRRPVLSGDGRRRRTSDRAEPDPRPGHQAGPEPHAEESRAGSGPGRAAGARGGTHGGSAKPAEHSAPDALEPAMATSPAVGYFSPREGWGPGRHVRSGDVVGYVDCLGVRQEVLSPVDGFLGRQLAQPGEAVEYGQPLLHVDLPAPVHAAADATPEPAPQRSVAGGEG